MGPRHPVATFEMYEMASLTRAGRITLHPVPGKEAGGVYDISAQAFLDLLHVIAKAAKAGSEVPLEDY